MVAPPELVPLEVEPPVVEARPVEPPLVDPAPDDPPLDVLPPVEPLWATQWPLAAQAVPVAQLTPGLLQLATQRPEELQIFVDPPVGLQAAS